MATNFKQDGEVLNLIAPSGGVVSGQGYMIGALFVVALTTAAHNAAFQGKATGVFTMVKLAAGSAKAFAAGEIVFWDNVNKRFDKTGAGLFPVGVATAAALTTADRCDVRLNGVAAIAA